jgi:hypothetical protein
MGGSTIRNNTVVKKINGYDVYVKLEGVAIIHNGKNYLTKVKITEVSTDIEKNVGLNNIIEARLLDENIRKGNVTYSVNTNHPLFHQFMNVALQEINDMGAFIYEVFDLDNQGYVIGEFKDGKYVPKVRDKYKQYGKDILRHFYKNYHYNGQLFTEDSNGNFHMTGNLFKSDRFVIYDERTGKVVNYGNEFLSKFIDFLNTTTKIENRVIITAKNGKYTGIQLSDYQKAALTNMIQRYISDFVRNQIQEIRPYESVLREYNRNANDYAEFALNYALMYSISNDLLEGDTKFYKNSQDVLKRAKEDQMGGIPFGIADFRRGELDRTEEINDTLAKDNVTCVSNTLTNERVPIRSKTTFNAITIKNTVRTSEDIKEQAKHLRNIGWSNEKIERVLGLMINEKGEVVENGISGFINTKTNDAQSYITFAEWVRRITAMGEYPKYKALIQKISSGEKLTPSEVETFIQVQKNVYYDLHYNSELNVYAPRQIKNAEFVLVPQFIEGTDLEKVYNFMMANGIDQLNTEETSKAGKANVFTIWDNDGKLQNLNELANQVALSPEGIETFSYNYLYRQQEVHQHVDAVNKAGIQIMKKILDNIPKGHKLYEVKQELFDLYSNNIVSSYESILRLVDAKLDKNGNVIFDEDGIMNFDQKVFFARLYEEAKRVGINSNDLAFLTLDADGNTIMPTWLSSFRNKLESIVQSVVNKNVTRQTLPGFHAAQVTGVGIKFGGKNNTNTVTTDTTGRLRYHPKINGKQENYIEVLIPRSKIFDGYTDEQIFSKGEDGLNMLERAGIDKIIGYRIPTEGKQSVAVMKIVGFVDKAQGSTIIVPDDWVSQTGADFDVDSIYAINYVLNKTKDGIERIQYLEDKDKSEEEIEFNRVNRFIDYVNEVYEDARRRYDDYSQFSSDKKALFTEAKKEFKEQKDKTHAEFKEKINSSEEKSLRDELKKTNKEIIDVVDDLLQTKSEPYLERVKAVIDYLQDKVDEQASPVEDSALQKYLDLYKSIKLDIDVFEQFLDKKKVEIYGAAAKAVLKLKIDYYNSKIDLLANKLGVEHLMKYEDFIKQSVAKQNSTSRRNTQLLDDMIKIASSDTSLEETLTGSHFRDIIAVRDDLMSKTAKDRRSARSAYNFFSQADYMEEVMSGKNLKAASVASDTFCSVCNTTKSSINNSLTVVYDLNKDDDIKLEEIEEAYPDCEKVYEDGKVVKVIVRHNRIGWSNNNRNVRGRFITVYTSETTAHHLDAVKEGGIMNVNEVTFGVYKLFTTLGSDFQTAISFIMQNGISRILRAYDASNSIFGNNYGRDYKTSALRSLALEMGLENISIYSSESDILNAIEEKYGDKFRAFLKQNMGLTEAQSKAFRFFDKMSDIGGQIPVSYNVNKSKIKFEDADHSAIIDDETFNEIALENKFYDLAVMMQYAYLERIANKVQEYARVCNPDKFGGKQSLFETEEVFNNIYNLISERNLDDSIIINAERENAEGKFEQKNMLEAIYPGIFNETKSNEENVRAFVASPFNTEESYYPSLYAFLKYGTGFSLQLGRKIFETRDPKFVNIIRSIGTSMGVRLTEELYNNFENFVLRHALINNFQEKDIIHIFGYDSTLLVDFTCDDVNNPTQEEKDAFDALSPAQKVGWIKRNSTNAGIFSMLDVRTKPRKFNNRFGYTPQVISYSGDSRNIEVAINAFNETAKSDNYFIQSALNSLVEYALVVEGFGFGRRKISKIISNEFLIDEGYRDFLENNKKTLMLNLMTNDASGLNLIDDDGNTDSIATDNEVVTNFVRSHSNKIRIFNNIDENNRPILLSTRDVKGASTSRMLYAGNIYNTEEEQTKKVTASGLVTINENTGVVDWKHFIRIRTKNDTTLYKAYFDEKTGNLYYMPMNLLEEEEDSKFSFVRSNNRFESEEYFIIQAKLHSAGESINIAERNQYKAPSFKDKTKFISFDMNGDANAFDNVYRADLEDQLKAIRDFANRQDSGKVLYVISSYFKNKLKNDNEFTDQVVDGKNYRIIKMRSYKSKLAKDVKGLKDNHSYKLTGSDRYQEFVRKIAAQQTNGGINSAYAIIETSDIGEGDGKVNIKTINSAKYSTADEYANEVLTDIQVEARSGDTEAASVLRDLRAMGIITDSEESVNANIKNVYARISKFVNWNANNFKDKIKEYITNPDTGETFSINSPEVLRKIMEDEEFRTEFLTFLNSFNSFVNRYSNVALVEIDSADPELQSFIQTMKDSMSILANNADIQAARKAFINVYLKAISTDPLIQSDIISLTDGYNNINMLERMFTDPREMGIPLLQVVFKEVLSNVDREQFMGTEAAKDYETTIQNIRQAAVSAGINIDMNKIIDSNGRFATTYNDKLREDYKAKKENVENLRRDKGEQSVEYLYAKREFDRWKNQHFELPIVKEYYDKLYAIEDEAIAADVNNFYAYESLGIEEMQAKHDYAENPTAENKNKLIALSARKSQMLSLANKNDKEVAKAKALRKYIQEISKLRKEYFEAKDKTMFNDYIIKCINTLNSFEKRDPNGNVTVPMDQLMLNEDYKQASEWLKENATFVPSKDLQEFINKVDDAFDIASKSAGIYSTIIKSADAYDAYGVVDGTKLSDAQRAAIKAEMEEKYGTTKSGSKLIRNKTVNSELVFNDDFYDLFMPNSKGKVTRNYAALSKEINEILAKVYNPVTGQVNTANLSKEDLIKLAEKYAKISEYSHFIRSKVARKKLAASLEQNIDFVVDEARFNEEYAKVKGTEKEDAWLTANQMAITDDSDNIIGYEPNNMLYGYAKPKGIEYEIKVDNKGIITEITTNDGSDVSKYVDVKKTIAKSIRANLMQTITTDYYATARLNAQSNGNFEEWYANNHVYNPYTQQMEPLRCWTTNQYKNVEYLKPGQDFTDGKLQYRWEVKNSRVGTQVKEQYKNANHKDVGTIHNYKQGSNSIYDNNVSLNQYEQQIMETMQNTLYNMVHTAAGKRSLSRGFAPSMARGETERNLKWYAKQIGMLTGYYDSTNFGEFTENLEYGNEPDMDTPMMGQLKNKLSRPLLYKRKRETFATDEEYEAYSKSIDEQNAKIREDNEKIHQEMLNRNWDEVMKQFITRTSRFNALQNNKQLLYFALNELQNMRYYNQNVGRRMIQRDKKRSSTNKKAYEKVKYDEAIKLYQTFMRRLIYGQHKKNNGILTRSANVLQNVTSAKFMMLNVTGGIGNVLYGEKEIFGEWIAKEYFGAKDWAIGKALWVQSIPSFLANMYSDKANSLPDGLIKLMNVVDFDRINELSVKGVSGFLKNFRNAMYGLNSMGEHFMQNGALLAMFSNHRLVQLEDGTYKVMNIDQYKRQSELKAFKEICEKYHLEDQYEAFKKTITNDPNLAKEYAQRREFVISSFFKYKLKDYDKINEFTTLREKYEKEAETKFNEYSLMMDQFELSDGYAKFKEDSILGQMDKKDAYKLLALFKQKIIAVNTHIHGVYDRLGAAKIEQEWYGSLVMQYHKHIPSGITKRFRRQGYYHEIRETVQKGYYTSLFDFLGTPIREMRTNAYMTEGQKISAIGIQEYFKATIDFFRHIKANWKLLPASERNNIRRCLSDIMGFVSAVAFSVAIKCLADDDDEDGLMYNLAIYSADRLATESIMYVMPMSSFKQLYNQPVAAMASIEDCTKAMDIISAYMLYGSNYDFTYKSGLHRGENKLTSLALRNVPIYRGLHQAYSLKKNNRFYKLRDNNNQKIATSIANGLKGRDYSTGGLNMWY